MNFRSVSFMCFGISVSSNLKYDLLEGRSSTVPLTESKRFYVMRDSIAAFRSRTRVTLGAIVDLLEQFKQQPKTLLMPKMPDGSFAKKLFSLYLTYLPKEKFAYPLKMNVDDRGSFTELVHTQDCGQVSINISKPGLPRGSIGTTANGSFLLLCQGMA